MDISIARRGTNLEIKLLKVRHKLRPTYLFPLLTKLCSKAGIFLDMCGIPLIKFTVADHKDGHDVKCQN